MARVALIGENSIEYIDKLIDIWNNGDCAVLIDWRIPFNTALDMMNEAGVKKCIIQMGIWGEFKTKENLFFEVFEKNQKGTQCLPTSIYKKFFSNYNRSEAVIIYSSGTTGKSKGVILSHYAINTNADSIIDYMKPSSTDCIYIAKTLSHSSTITGELLVALKTKIKTVIAPIIIPPRIILKNINKFDVTIICLNPTLLKLVSLEQEKHTNDIHSLKKIYVSGSILSEQVYRLSKKIFYNVEIYNVYGLSECGPRVSAQTNLCNNEHNSVGKPIKDVKIKIVNRNGKEVCANEIGIIHVTTPSLFDGYIAGEIKHKSIYKEWLNTGDLGYCDQFGELHIIGRYDNCFTYQSHNIYPEEIENVVGKTNKIEECLVYGNDHQIVCAYTSKTKNPLTSFEIREIINECRQHLALYELPTEFRYIKEFKKTTSGKIKREEY